MARSPSRGFRLYEVRVYPGRSRTPAPFGPDDHSFGEHLYKIATERLLNEKLTTAPRVDAFTAPPAVAEDSASAPLAIFEVRQVTRTGRRIFLQYRAGSVGSHTWAVSGLAGDPDIDVREHAVLNDQRAWFLVPPAGRTVGLLVAESAGRAAGEETLRRWLHAASRVEPESWRIGLRAVSDPEHIQDLISEESVREIVLTRRAEQPDRSTTQEPFTIRAPLKVASSRRRAAERLQDWVTRREHPLSLREGAQELAAIIEPSFSHLEFDDGYVRVQGDEDSGQQLRPDLARDIFTYRLDAAEPTEGAVLRRAREVADRIQGLSELDLPWP